MAKKSQKKRLPVATLYKEYYANTMDILKAFHITSAAIHDLFPDKAPTYHLVLKFPRLVLPDAQLRMKSSGMYLIVAMSASSDKVVEQLVNDILKRVEPSAKKYDIEKLGRRSWPGFLKSLAEKHS